LLAAISAHLSANGNLKLFFPRGIAGAVRILSKLYGHADRYRTDVFSEAQHIDETGGKTVSSAGVTFDADAALGNGADVDSLFLLGSPVSRFENEKHGNAVLRAAARQGMTLGAVSGGVFALARSGVMEGRKCSVHWCYESAFCSEFPHIEAASDLIVSDGRCITVAGSAAAFDLALQLIETALGPAISHEVACWFQHPMMRGEGVVQAKPYHPTAERALPNLVSRAIQIFSRNLEDALGINDIAAELGVSPPQVERAFKSALDQSPSVYFRSLRMRAARQFVRYSKDSVQQIAFAVGYTNAGTLNKHYQAAYGVSPAQDRAQTNAFRVRGRGPLPDC